MRIIQPIIALSCGGVGATTFEFSAINCPDNVLAKFRSIMGFSFADWMQKLPVAEGEMRAFIEGQNDVTCKEDLKRVIRESKHAFAERISSFGDSFLNEHVHGTIDDGDSGIQAMLRDIQDHHLRHREEESGHETADQMRRNLETAAQETSVAGIMSDLGGTE